MENCSLLNQKIKFPESNLEDIQKSEVQIALSKDKIIDSLLHINLTQNNSTETNKLEELCKKHSNELLILKCFFKLQFDLLQEKLSVSKASVQQLKEQSAYNQSAFAEKITDLELKGQQLQEENSRLTFVLTDYSSKISSSESQIKILENHNKELEHQRGQLTNEILTIHKEHNTKLYELKEIHEQEKLSLRNSNQLLCTIDSIEINNLYGIYHLKKIQEKLISISTAWKSKIESAIRGFESQINTTSSISINEKAQFTQLILKYSTSTLDTFKKLSKSIKTIREDLIEIKTAVEILTAPYKSNNTNRPNLSSEKSRFCSPVHEKSLVVDNKKHSNSCRKLDRNFMQKPPVHSPKSLRAQTLNLSQSAPFMIPFSSNTDQRHSNANTSVSLQKSLDISEMGLLKNTMGASYNENIPYGLKLQISKAKNQRDRARLDNEKMLMELKESKFLLAIEKERYSEKLNKIENDFRNISKYLKKIIEDGNIGEAGRQIISGSMQSITKLLTML